MENGEGAAAADDEVVFEADVVLSQPAAEADLFLLQYPLRTSAVRIGEERAVEGVSVRPRYGRVELRLATRPSVEQLSGGRESCGASFDDFQERAAEKAIGATQVLRSQPALPKPHANYAAASFVRPPGGGGGGGGRRGGSAAQPALIVAPLRSVAQLRPTFDYIDKRAAAIARQRVDDRAARASVRGEKPDVGGGGGGGDAGDSPAPLQLSFRRRESERAAARRRSSHASLTRKEAEEPWIPLEYVAEGDGARAARLRLFGAARAAAAAAVPVKAENATARVSAVPAAVEPDTNYMDLFQAHTRSIKHGISAKGVVASEPLSLRHLQRLPPNTAVAQLVTFARIVRFEDLLRVAPPSVPPEEVVNATRIVAVCLRGCWVAKNGPHSGAAKARRGAERYDAARVLIHNLFRSSRVVKTSEAIHVLGACPALGDGSVTAVLSEVARRQHGVGWVFKTEDDVLFLEEYSDLVSAQNSDWDRRVAMSLNTLGLRQKR